ncbi:MAG: acyltransferase family protein [Paraprevotella sp.]|nr:acyltransferase family protein [Paraprevotella sp.]
MKTYFPIVNVLKLILAVFVVASHVRAIVPDESFSATINFIWPLAVPFFFIASGYFLSTKLLRQTSSTECYNILVCRSKQVARMWGIWMLIYLPLSLLFFFESDIPLPRFIYQYLFSAFLFGESHFAWMLWFIYSMAISLYIIALIAYKFKRSVLLILFIFPVLIHCFLPYLDVANREWLILQIMSRLFSGGGYLLIGYFIARTISTTVLFEPRFHCRMNVVIIGLLAMVLGVGMYAMEIPLFRVFGGGGAVLLGLSYQQQFRPGRLVKSFGNISAWIYFLHLYVVRFADAYFVQSYNINQVFLITAGISVLLSVVVYVLQQTRYFKWLSFLVS